MESHRNGAPRRRRGRRVATACLALLAAGCSLSSNIVANPGAAFESDSSTVQVLSAVLGGKNVFVPSTIVVTADTPYTLSIYNATDTIHGFAIAGAGVEAVLQPKQETPVSLPALEAGHLYRIHCQLHGAHRTATLVVVPQR